MMLLKNTTTSCSLSSLSSTATTSISHSLISNDLQRQPSQITDLETFARSQDGVFNLRAV